MSRHGSFLVYILPVIVGEVIVGTVRGDMAFGPEMLPPLAMWGLAGRLQAVVPIAWAVLFIGEPVLESQFDVTRGAISILTATGWERAS